MGSKLNCQTTTIRIDVTLYTSIVIDRLGYFDRFGIQLFPMQLLGHWEIIFFTDFPWKCIETNKYVVQKYERNSVHNGVVVKS